MRFQPHIDVVGKNCYSKILSLNVFDINSVLLLISSCLCIFFHVISGSIYSY